VEPYVLWVIAGIALAVAELMSGGFYLLVLGLSALVAAAVAWLGGSFNVQVIVAGALAIAGILWLRAHRKGMAAPDMRPLDLGQPVQLESWTNRDDRLARVKYRDALWDAVVEGEFRGEAGEVFYITAVSGNLLHVAKQRGV